MHHDTSLPRLRGGAVSRLAVALAAATLFGCSDRSATGPEDQLAEEAGVPAATVEESTAVAAASRLPKSFFVNPKSGNGTGPGSQAKPFKTLAKGLSLAIAGDTIRLASGTYSAAANGEKFTMSARQVTVPASVKLFGTPDPFVILQGARAT